MCDGLEVAARCGLMQRQGEEVLIVSHRVCRILDRGAVGAVRPSRWPDRCRAIDTARSDGWFLWACVPEWVDSMQQVTQARSAGILLAHGSLFSVCARSRQYLRFNTAYAGDPLLLRFLAERCRLDRR